MKTQATPESGQDALELLMSGHKEIKKFFSDFERIKDETGSGNEKGVIVHTSCRALTIHARIEEEIFYPEVRRHVAAMEILDEAEVEHAGARDLITQLEAMRPGDNLYDAKFLVLAENVKHHIREEEGGLFPLVRKSGMNLVALGQRMAERKAELEAEAGFLPGTQGVGSSLHNLRE